MKTRELGAAVGSGVLVVALHLVANAAHGWAHLAVGVAPPAGSEPFIAIVILAMPVIAIATAARWPRASAWALGTSMLASLAFGVAWHFVIDSIDRCDHVGGASPAAATFSASAVALAVLALLSDDGGRLLRRGALVLAVVGVAYVPWLPVLVSQAQNTGAPWSFTPSVREVVRELAALFRDERVLVALGLATVTGLTPLVRRRPTRDGLAVTCLMMLTAVPVIVGWAVAHVEPSWATRYLAVVVGPMLLVVAVGLARARLVGIGALAVAAVLILQPITRLEGTFRVPADAKSNAHAVAERMAPRLAPGDLVLVAQPEAVPLLHHELGDDLTYADPTGIVEDPTVMDWRDALPRLQAATHAADTAPLVDALAPGARVLVVLAGNDAKRTDTDWITSFRSAGRRIQQALRSDPGLVTVDRIRGSERPYVTFDAVLYERRAG